jgi:hypothetical protein
MNPAGAGLAPARRARGAFGGNRLRSVPFERRWLVAYHDFRLCWRVSFTTNGDVFRDEGSNHLHGG